MTADDQHAVLVVDDETMVGEMLARYLKREGFRGMAAHSGEEAMKLLTKTSVNLVLLDVKLGDEDGFDVLKKIKEQHPGLPVVMLTGLGYDDKAMAEALELGAAGYLSKSADVSEVGVTVRRVLGTSIHKQPGS